jgi:hypothetical protein
LFLSSRKYDPDPDFFTHPGFTRSRIRHTALHDLNVPYIHRIHAGGEKGLTVGGLCEAVAGLKFNPGEHVYLENIDIQVMPGDRV